MFSIQIHAQPLSLSHTHTHTHTHTHKKKKNTYSLSNGSVEGCRLKN
jgi:hypothetical protein